MGLDLQPAAFKACKQKAIDQVPGAHPKYGGSGIVACSEKDEILVLGHNDFSFDSGAGPY